MILQWKTFSIDLPSLGAFLKTNISKADGIVADIDTFEIIEKEPFDQEDAEAIQTYYDSLTEDGEAIKSAIPAATIIKNKILGAMEFGKDLIAEYGASNVISGFSLEQIQAIMTRTSKVRGALNSGALYVALSELDLIQTDDYLITTDKITQVKSKIQTYLEG